MDARANTKMAIIHIGCALIGIVAQTKTAIAITEKGKTMTNPVTRASTMTRGGMMPSVTDAQRRIADGKGETMSDLISRQAAIDARCNR